MSVTGQAQTSADRMAGEPAPVVSPALGPVVAEPKHSGGIHWGPLLRRVVDVCRHRTIGADRQGIEAPESTGRTVLSGDWFDTVSAHHFDNWNDGGKVFTSYIAHPAMGATTQAIFWQNNDHVRFAEQDFKSPVYRKALLQAFALAAADAVIWKLGPLSESSIGNVGLPVKWWDKDCKALHIPCVDRTGVSDMVMNEVGGTAMTIGFQWLDKHLQRRIESRFQNRYFINTTRMLTYPPQCLADVVRFRAPWYRDNRR